MAYTRNDFIQVINSVTGETTFMLKSDLKNYQHITDSEGNIHVMPNRKPKSNIQIPNPHNGCILVLCILFTVFMGMGCVFIIQKEYKHNKRHTNVISYVNDTDKIIIISDVNTHEERMIGYKGYKDKFAKQNKLPEFEEQVNTSNIGDTVGFVSPDYEARRKFTLDNKNRLYLNADSIITRIKKAKQR